MKEFIKRPVGRMLFRIGRYAPTMKPVLKPWGLRTTKEWFAGQHGSVQLHNGRSIELTEIDQNYLSLELFWRGADYYEPITTRVMREVLGSGAVLLDIGANIGFHSLVQTALNPALRAIAFEPNPKMFRILKRNVQVNAPTRITCLPYALSDTVGTAELHLSESDMSASLRSDFDPHRVGEVVNVRAATLDHILTMHPIEARLVLKVDVEGQEEPFLVGARETLAKRKPDMIMEVALRFSDQSNRILRERGYHFYQITDRGLIESPTLVPVVRDRFVFLNYLISTKPVDWANDLFNRIADSVKQIDLRETSKFVGDECISSLNTRKSAFEIAGV